MLKRQTGTVEIVSLHFAAMCDDAGGAPIHGEAALPASGVAARRPNPWLEMTEPNEPRTDYT